MHSSPNIMAIFGIALLVVVMIACSHEHGMLMEPVNRASMWRLGYSTPVDYDDNQLYCGGLTAQWTVNGGKCGECGDDYRDPRPRAHENGGKYGTGIVVRKYKAGSTIKTVGRLNTNHKGSFYYRLCPLSSKGQPETQDCFDKHPLKLEDGSDSYKLPHYNSGDFEANVVLPVDITCEYCVLQWTYITANNWGICPNGTGAAGCGPQETFRTCSDISIY